MSFLNKKSIFYRKFTLLLNLRYICSILLIANIFCIDAKLRTRSHECDFGMVFNGTYCEGMIIYYTVYIINA